MKNYRKTNRKGFTLVELLVVIAIIVALAALTTPAVFKALGKAAQATSISNLKDIHKSMTMFAMDNDGLFPSEELTEDYAVNGTTYSNDYFKQLFAAELLDGAENLFWVKGSQVCNKKAPDGVTTQGGDFAEDRTLEAGDVGYSYIAEQTNTDNSARPLMFDAPLDGGEFDTELWGSKVLVLRLGGDAKAEKLDARTDKLLDGDGQELLSSSSEIWGNVTDIQTRIKDPLPK